MCKNCKYADLVYVINGKDKKRLMCMNENSEYYKFVPSDCVCDEYEPREDSDTE